MLQLSRLFQETSNSMFERAFAVNLDRSPGRWKDFAALATRLSLPLERWPAVDGANLLPSQFPDYFTSDCKISGFVVGATLSQIGIWREALRRGHSAVAVFEDDATTTLTRYELEAHLERASSAVGDQYDVLYLGKCCDFCGKHTEVAPGIVRLYRTACLHAYVITARGIRKLLSALPMNKVADMWLADLMEQGYIEAYGFHPSLFTQNVEQHPSTLQAQKTATRNNNRACAGGFSEWLHVSFNRIGRSWSALVLILAVAGVAILAMLNQRHRLTLASEI